tara:strand:- start:506 stop:841 length:336 start_codon:yes stop_codon:yes gene_type:complete
MKEKKIKTLDIGHNNLNIDSAISLLEVTISQLSYEGEVRAVKVITGCGTGKLRKAVRTWVDEQEGRFRGVVYGENYDVFNTLSSDMRAECAIRNDNDFGRKNSGVTYIWLW